MTSNDGIGCNKKELYWTV